jgi:large subunit ribosomal protein L15
MVNDMPTRKRSKRAGFRGSRTCGWGKHSRHRGHGSQGGAGMAGGKKHKKTWMVKYAPNRIGKFGFHSLQQRGISRRDAAVNVSDLESMAAGKKEISFDGKVLGGGSIKSPLIVKASYFTASAKAKIEKAGGKCVSSEEAEA